MPMNEQVRNYVRDWKSKNPMFANRDDEMVGRLLSRKNMLPEGMVYEAPKPIEVQPKPKESNLSFLGDLLDYTITEDSADFFKEAYNRSLTSEASKALLGKEKYDTGRYAEDMNVIEDIGATVLSFMFPLDILAMKVGGKLGVMGWQGATGKIAPHITKAGLPVEAALSERLLFGAAGQAGGLAAYEGAFGGISAYNEGKSEKEILEATTEGVFHGGILGAITGAVGQGMAAKQAELLKKGLWNKSKKAKDGVGKALTKGEERFINLTLGVPGQIAAESAVFTGSEMIDRVQAGEDVDAKDALVAFAKNAGLFGTLKAKSKLWKDTQAVIKEPMKMLENEVRKRKEKSYDNVKEELRENNKDGSLDREIDVLDKEAQKSKGIREESEAELRKIRTKNDSLIDILEGKQIELSAKQVAEFINQGNNNLGVLRNRSKSLETRIEKAEGADKTALKEQKARIDEYVKEWEDLSKDYNSTARGEKPKIDIVKETEEGMIDYLSDKKVETLTRTVEGKKVQIPIMEATKEELSRRIDSIRESEKKLSVSTAEQTVELLHKAEGMIDPIKAFKATFTEAGVSVNKATTGQGKGYAELVRKKGEDGYILSKDSQKKIIIGIKESFPYSKGTKSTVEAVIDYAKWLEKNGFKLGKRHGKNEIVRYLEETGQWADRNKVLRKLAKFFGTRHATGKLNIASGLGFAGRFMKKNIDVLDVTWKEVEPGKATRIDPSDKKLIDKTLSGITDKNIIDIGKGQKGSASKETSSTIVDLLYKFPKRIAEVLRLRAGDINTKTGEVSFFITKQRNQEVYRSLKDGKDIKDSKGNLITGKAQKINIGKTNPELFKKLKALSEGKEVGDFLFTTTEGNVLLQSSVNNVIKEALKRAGVTPKSIRGGEKFTAHNFRHSAVADAEAIFRETGKDYRKLAEDIILAHGDKKGAYKHYVDTAAGRKDIAKELLEFNKDRKKIKTVTEEDSIRAEEILKSKKEGKESEQVKEEIETKHQLKKDVKLDTASIKELERQIEYFSNIPAYKNIQIKLHKTLGKFRGEQVLGRIRGHIIDIAQGKAKIDTIPHEISHHAVDVLTAIGTKKSKALIRDGKKMFGSEEKLVQALGEYTAGRMKNRSMVSRAKEFVSRMMSEVRNFFGIQTEGDVVRILSEKVLKGKLDTRTPQEILKADAVKFQTGKEATETKKRFNKTIHKFEKILLKEGMTRAEINQMRKDYITSSYMRDKKHRTYDTPKVEIAELEMYKDYLMTKLDGTAGTGRTIREANMEYQITPSQQKRILEALGVREGKLDNIKNEHNTIKQYLAFVRKYGTRTNPEDTTSINIGKLGESIQLPWGVKRAIMPVYYVLDTYGGKAGKKIAQKIIDFDYIHNYKIKGEGDHHAHNIHKHLKKGGHQENFWLLDGEMRKKVMSERDLTAKEKEFVKQMDIRGSDVYIAREHYRNMTEGYWKMLMSAAKKHHNPVEFALFEDRMGSKYVRDYMTRRVSREALDIIKDGNFIEKASKSLVDKAVAREVLKSKGKLTRAQIEQNAEKMATIKREIYKDMLNIFEHKHHKIKNGYLMKRVPVLPEYVEGTGADGKLKRVKTYETSSEAIVDPYVSGMSKYIATVEVFPEYTNIGGKFSLKGSKMATLEMEAGDAEFAQYAKKGIRRIIGLEQQDLFHSKTARVGQSFASTSAVVGLSSPLSGMKNLILGQIRNVASYGLMNTAKGVRLAFNPEAKEIARLKGSLEYGAKTLELSDQKAFGLFRMDKAFKLNLMTQSENINRISAMEAGRLQFVEQMNNLQGKHGILGTRMKEGQVRDMMKDMWRLNNEQIDFLKKGEFNKPQNRKKLEGIMEVVEHFSHVSSQGGTGVGNLPLWMSHQQVKPFLLFQRFATAVTWDTYRNYFVPAIKHGNFAPMIAATFGSYLGGELLYQVYEHMFNTQPPKTGSGFFEKAMMNLHRAEFLGVFNELITPYDQRFGTLPNPVMEPVIIRNAIEASKNLYKATPEAFGGEGSKTLDQALKDFTRKTVVIAAQAEKFYDARVHPDYSNQKRVNTMAKEFKDQRGISQVNVTTGTTRSPYYRKLKENMYFGTDEQIARSYWAAHNVVCRELQHSNPTMTKSKIKKEAHEAIMSSLRSMNPVNFSKEVKGRKFGVSQRQVFLNWIKANHGVRDWEMAKDLERKFKKNLNKAKRLKSFSRYRRLYSVGNSF